MSCWREKQSQTFTSTHWRLHHDWLSFRSASERRVDGSRQVQWNASWLCQLLALSTFQLKRESLASWEPALTVQFFSERARNPWRCAEYKIYKEQTNILRIKITFTKFMYYSHVLFMYHYVISLLFHILV